MPTQYDIIIIGGGPAGLTAATYARRAGKSVLVLEKAAFGGQITWSPKVENFPGELSITGTELGDRFLEQAMNQGAEVELEEVTSLEKTPGGFCISTDSGTIYSSRTLCSQDASGHCNGTEKHILYKLNLCCKGDCRHLLLGYLAQHQGISGRNQRQHQALDDNRHCQCIQSTIKSFVINCSHS